MVVSGNYRMVILIFILKNFSGQNFKLNGFVNTEFGQRGDGGGETY